MDTAARQGKKKVLVIDDNLDQLELNRAFLEMDHYVPITASGGREGLRILSRTEGIGLILLDMQMPEMSGPEFLIEFERQQPDMFEKIPVVFLTAMDEIPESKAAGFIRKPMDIDYFLATVHRYTDIEPGHVQN